jgi:Ca2+-binding RTX toxin-like protein
MAYVWGDSADNVLVGQWGQQDILSGMGGNDALYGFAENDTLQGGAGHDLLNGGSGRDKLYSGQGSDVFWLDQRESWNYDTFMDFNPNEDAILLTGAVYGLAPGALDPSAFVVGQAARDANDRIIYDMQSSFHGRLLYDADGSGRAYEAIALAIVQGKPALAAADFSIL